MNAKLNDIQNWPELAQKAAWSVSSLSKLCHVSTRTLERFFVKQKGISPGKWLKEQRQEKALELLRNSSTVKEAAYLLHYKYANNFTRGFKQFYGKSPRIEMQMIVKKNV